jgi:hypothetical protein
MSRIVPPPPPPAPSGDSALEASIAEPSLAEASVPEVSTPDASVVAGDAEVTAAGQPDPEDKELPVRSMIGDGRSWKVGQRVQFRRRVFREFLEKETGQPKAIVLGPAQSGVIVGFAHRTFHRSAFETNVALVRWDAQTWYEALPPPYQRMKIGVVYSGEDINRMAAEVGAAAHLGEFVAGAYFEELR